MTNMLKVIYGSISNGQVLIDNMCIIVDTTIGSIMKYGDRDKSDIITYYQEMQNKLRNIGCDDMADALKLVTFDRYEGKLSIEEICTIVNYGMNSHDVSFLQLFDMDESELHEKIIILQECGY